MNPPFNNWSVNQPSVPHDHGLNGKADLGQNIIVDGHAIHFAQRSEPTRLVQINNEEDMDFSQTALFIMTKDLDNEPGHFVIVDSDNTESLE